MPLKLIFIACPALVFLLWLTVRGMRGRAAARQAVTVGLSLLTLIYFGAVVATGIFWVAAQELPVFDWHYLTGYLLLALTGTHVVLHWRNVAAFLRRQAPASLLEPDGHRFATLPRRAAQALAVLIGLGLVFLMGVRQGSRRLTLLQATDAAATADTTWGAGALIPVQLVEAGGKRMPLAHLYHEGSSYPARLGLPGLTISARPPVYLDLPGAVVPLPPRPPDGPTGVVEAFEAWRTDRPLSPGVPLTLESLSSLLHHAQGISGTLKRPTGDFELRMAASAGALYPVNLYVAVENVPGLAPGFYAYHPKRDALVVVRSERYPASKVGSASGSPGTFDSAAAAIIFTVTFGRTAFKYEERAYRYVAMDTGHAAFNLSLAAAAAGLHAPMVARFDDGVLAAALGVDPGVEAPILVVPLAERVAPSEEPRFAPDPRPAVRPTFVDLIHGGTSLRAVGGRQPLGRHAADLDPAIAGEFALPSPRAGAPLLPTIRQRRSVRKHSEVPITLPELSALLAASVAEPDGKPSVDPLLSTTAPLRLYLVVRRVEGLAAGVYRYRPAGHALQALQAGERTTAVRQACLDQEFCGTAGVVLVKTVRWRDLYLPDGDRGYRYANLRAGLVGEGLYLAATALGLGPCGVGAFGDRDVAALLGIDLATEVPIYITAVGRP